MQGLGLGLALNHEFSPKGHERIEVIILDGLTKCWRMPGLRICWIVAPKTAARRAF